MKKENVKLNSQKIKEREMKIVAVKRGILIILVFLIIIYFILKVVYNGGNFTVYLDPDLAQEKGLIMYENLAEKNDRRILEATSVEYMDNICVKWLPDNLNEEAEGSHNGDNYLAYTFYVENKGSQAINYWYEILIDDVIKNVDKAVRVMVYRNDDVTIYAKANETTGEAEGEGAEQTVKFYSSTEVMLEEREDFKPGDIDKFTIVIFIEGDDPDCVDALIGGEMKMHMEITEEHITEE